MPDVTFIPGTADWKLAYGPFRYRRVGPPGDDHNVYEVYAGGIMLGTAGTQRRAFRGCRGNCTRWVAVTVDGTNHGPYTSRDDAAEFLRFDTLAALGYVSRR